MEIKLPLAHHLRRIESDEADLFEPFPAVKAWMGNFPSVLRNPAREAIGITVGSVKKRSRGRQLC
jgi:hypothetical protein